MEKTMNEDRIVEKAALLSDEGRLAHPGYATELLLSYERSRIKAPKWRIKEWDYYLINDGEYAVALTLADMGYMGLISASVVDFAKAAYKTTSVLVPFPMGRFRLPESSAQGVSVFENSRVRLRFEVDAGRRTLTAHFARFDGDEDLRFEAILDDEPRDSMVIATPWKEDPLAFYYNQKIVAMRAHGSFTKGALTHEFDRSDSFGLLDWGRGVWTRDNTWFWGVAQGWQDGTGKSTPGSHRFGFNLGYGFGDTSAASENMIFLDGVCHKLGRVVFEIVEKPTSGGRPKRLADRYELLQPWHIYDEEQRLDLTFEPLLDRADTTDVGLVISDQHQVFGKLSGTVILDDGSTFIVGDLIGSAEVVRNKY
jgi:hypothetical protein